MRQGIVRSLVFVLAVLGLTACGEKAVKEDTDQGASVGVESRDTGKAADAGSSAGAASGQGGDRDARATAHAANVQPTAFVGDPLDNPNSVLRERIVYFAYDSSRVDPRYRVMLDAHAAYLAEHPNVRVVVEGHGDERGSREYNVGLGERRAQAVRRFLLFQGASGRQIEVVSYGEEQPASLGHNEAAWSQNRRVVLRYQGR